MSAGVPLREYAKFSLACFVAMMMGAQTVHAIYRPLDDLPQVIEKMRQERQRLRQEEENAKLKGVVDGS